MREYIALGSSLVGSVIGLVAIVEVPPGGQIATGKILLVVGCFAIVGLARFWPERKKWYSDARKVRR